MLQTVEFETHDRDEAVGALSALSGTGMRVDGRGPLYVKTAITVGDVVTEVAAEFGTSYSAVNDPVDLIHVVGTSSGYGLEAPGRRYDLARGQTLRSPTHEACRFEIIPGGFTVTAIQGDAVRQVASEVFLDRPVALDPDAVLPTSPELEKMWLASIGYYRDHILQPETYDCELVRREATRSLIVTAIIAFGLHRPRSYAAEPTSAMRRARAYIDEHLREPVTVHDIAVAAQMSVRGLQYAFQSAYGMSPMAYVRSGRLAGVRQELLEADPGGGVTVAVLARRWGFAHLGRFSGTYHAAFGEYPNATMRR